MIMHRAQLSPALSLTSTLSQSALPLAQYSEISLLTDLHLGVVYSAAARPR
jgi:hypothetical protein